MSKLLSIIILSYNTKELLNNCLDSITKIKKDLDFEVIVVDNNSSDDSVKMVKKNFPWVKIIAKDENLGFAKGNNQARSEVKGKYILFLNSDTLVYSNVLNECINQFELSSNLGAMTCKVVLPNGSLDKDTRRSFPYPWVALTHFTKLDRIFPQSKLFSKYWYSYIDEDTTHYVDCIQGAFFLTTKEILDSVNWFDEDYFLDGEDIDLCWKIKDKGYNILYYPKVFITHLKGASKGKNKSMKIDYKKRLKIVIAGVNSMEIFYKKYLRIKYPFFLNFLVYIGIKLLKLVRYTQVYLYR